MTSNDIRLSALKAWLATDAAHLGLDLDTMRPASTDASFRRYFRVNSPQGSLIIMDAPPPLESTQAFLHVTELLQAAKLRVPQILASEPEQGFLVLTDLGESSYLDALRADPRPSETQLDAWYAAALECLVHMQRTTNSASLPQYDAARMLAELELFPQWY